MAIRSTDYGGTAMGAEEAKSVDWNDTFAATKPKFYADNTGGTANNTTTETDLATITINQNDLTDDSTLVINAGIWAKHAETNSLNFTFRLYVNGAVVKTIIFPLESGNTGDDIGNGTSFNYLATGIDTTVGNVIVKVTGQPSSALSSSSVNCGGLTVVGYKG